MKIRLVQTVLTPLMVFSLVTPVFAATKTTRCLPAVNTALRALKASAKQCGNAKDNIVALKSQKLGVTFGSADDLFSLFLSRIGATTEEIAQIVTAENEIQSRRDTMLADLTEEIDSALNQSTEVCQDFTANTSAYNKAVISCSRAKKQTVILGCSVSLRYSKRDLTALNKRCKGYTQLATDMPLDKAAILANADADRDSLGKILEKAKTSEEKNEIQQMLKELATERANQVEYYDLGISKVNQYKTNACSDAKTAETSYANLVKDCRKK